MPAAPSIDLTAKPKNKKIIFDDDGEAHANGNLSTAKAHKHLAVKSHKLPKKKIFTENLESDDIKTENSHDAALKDESAVDEDDYFAKREKQQLQQEQQKSNEYDAQQKWYHVYHQYPSSEEVLDMKESEQMELYNLCKTAFQSEQSVFSKRNPSDARWLQTALHKGTAKDRANAGALLVASNPLGNLEALSALIGQTKMSNKASTDVISILTDLWQEVLLPPHRKLLSIPLRGADWKLVRKDTNITKEQLKRIYAYWHFENELKDQYFEFLKNLQQGIQTGQESNKNNAIIAAAQLLAYAPEKEQMLLTMLVNKLGDPLPKVASKALHHLTTVAHSHPNMCGVIVTETEKLLFRNNISDRAQHFALCFLASLAPAGNADVCTKLVNICFALFKVLVQKGAVNTRMMQAILRCLQKAIAEAAPAKGSTEILSKEMQDTVYRLVHLADIRVAVQTLGLLMQLITVKTEKSDRFYNALYVKLTDMELVNIGSKTAAQLLHIVHRAIHHDSNLARAQAFMKRLLQLALYMPPHIGAGCLIVLSKLLRSRKELQDALRAEQLEAKAAAVVPTVRADDEELARFDSDGEEKYEDVTADDDVADKAAEPTSEIVSKESATKASSSWHHTKLAEPTVTSEKVREIGASKYDAYHRVPAFAGAEYALRNELLLLREHFHPTVQVFAESVLNDKRIAYYGDPLRDFSLPHFLERFAFKNPKKLDTSKTETGAIAHKRYVSFGTRGKSVKELTRENCTEDEMYIFNYLEQKRQQATEVQKTKADSEDEEDDDGLKPGEVDDDEFDDYLDGFFGKKSKADGEELDEEDVDFLKELGGELKEDKMPKKKKQKKSTVEDEDDDMDDIDADWGDDDEMDTLQAVSSDVSDDEVGSLDDEAEVDDGDMSMDGSISLDGEDASAAEDSNDDDDAEGSLEAFSDADGSGSELDSDDELAPPKSKKSRKQTAKPLDGKNFAKTLKYSDDMRSLFAAADDFAELLEEAGQSKGQGTANAIFNKDKSSDKQMKWEEQRRSGAKKYGGPSGGKHKKSQIAAGGKVKKGASSGGGGKRNFAAKKRKH